MNKLATAIFEDSEAIEQWGPGYALLHCDFMNDVPDFCLLRYNLWFEKVL